jgi:hypothetical protein
MAHATDYASRLREQPISITARVTMQLMRYFDHDILSTSEQSLKELCLMQYSGLGLTPELYDEIRAEWLKPKGK